MRSPSKGRFKKEKKGPRDTPMFGGQQGEEEEAKKV